MELPELVSLCIGVLGVAGLIFTALKYNRDDTTAILAQQNTIVGEMKVLNDELRATTVSLRSERDALRVEVDRLSVKIDQLQRGQG